MLGNYGRDIMAQLLSGHYDNDLCTIKLGSVRLLFVIEIHQTVVSSSIAINV